MGPNYSGESNKHRDRDGTGRAPTSTYEEQLTELAQKSDILQVLHLYTLTRLHIDFRLIIAVVQMRRTFSTTWQLKIISVKVKYHVVEGVRLTIMPLSLFVAQLHLGQY
ncbi:hypothetical protein E2P81_ATG04073 [Venturia nashicola]|nr:hypothetical protein E2P81_ATG04073 [Venturia nashicola]